MDEPVSTENDAKDPRHENREGRGLFARIGLFVRQVVSELKRVVTPSREEWKQYTWVVTVFILIIVALVMALDFGFGELVKKVFGA